MPTATAAAPTAIRRGGRVPRRYKVGDAVYLIDQYNGRSTTTRHYRVIWPTTAAGRVMIMGWSWEKFWVRETDLMPAVHLSESTEKGHNVTQS